MDHIRTNIQGLIMCTHTLKVAAKFSVEYLSFVSATQDSIYSTTFFSDVGLQEDELAFS